MPEVSVAIPLYNKAPHIARALDSVLAQTVQDFEIVVVDDGSTDNGGQIVASYTDSRIRLIRQENQGVSAARNRGITEARSEFLAFLDADDEWTSDHLETLLRLRRTFPQAGAYSTAYSYYRPDGKIDPVKIPGIPLAPWEGIFPDYFESSCYNDPPVNASAVAIPKDVFYKVGYFKVGEKMGEDLDMWGRIALRYPIAFSWTGIIYYREDSTARACLRNPIDRDLPFVAAIKEQYKPEELAPSVLKYVGELQRHRVHSLLLRGKRWEAFKALLLIDFSTCRKYSYFRSLFWIILPEKLAKSVGALKRMCSAPLKSSH